MVAGIIIGLLIAIALFVSFGIGVKIGGEAAKEKLELQLGETIDRIKERLNGRE